MGIHYGQADFINYGKPSLFLDFANKKSLVDRISGNNLITFERASIGTYVGADGLIKTAAADEARFDHNPTTGESLGLLIEEQRTNFAKKSGELNNTTYWTQDYNVNATTAPSITAPDGSTDTWKLVVANNTGQQRFALNSSQGTFGANTYTWSVFAKAAEYSYLGISLYDGTYYRATFNLSDGTTSNTSNATPNITPYPNGWYRCSITATTTANLRNSANYVDGFWPYATAVTTGAAQTGDGISGVYVWGPQLEVGSFPTSYVTTGDTTSTVTRQVDYPRITGTNFSNFYNQTEGTLFIHANKSETVNDMGVTINNMSSVTNNRIELRLTGNDTSTTRYVINSGGVGYLDTTTPITDVNKYSFAFAQNNAIPCANGTLGTLDTVVEMPIGVNQMTIGRTPAFSGDSTTRIRQVSYYPTRLTNTQLQQLTQ